MNIPKRAIELAIEGGWLPKGTYGSRTSKPLRFEILPEALEAVVFTLREQHDHLEPITVRMKFAEIALDPLFFQALGKALGWEEYKPVCEEKEDYLEWKEQAHRFYDLILTGGNKREVMCCRKCETNDGHPAMCMIPSCNCHKSPIEKFWNDLLSK